MAQRLEAALKRPLTPASAGAAAARTAAASPSAPSPSAPSPSAPAPSAPPPADMPAKPRPAPEFDLAAAVAAELNLDSDQPGPEDGDEKKPGENVSIYDEILKRDT